MPWDVIRIVETITQSKPRNLQDIKISGFAKSSAMDLFSLNLLLSAPSKQVVEQLLNFVFITRHQPIDVCEADESSPLQRMREIIGFEDDVSDAQIKNLRDALVECIEQPLSSGQIEDLAELFNSEGEQVNPKLKQLVGQLVQANLETWREASLLDRIAMPRLQDFDWSLHFKRASSEISDIQIPGVMMNLTVENLPTSTTSMSETQQIKFELSREALETMIDGFGKIRDQLSNMK